MVYIFLKFRRNDEVGGSSYERLDMVFCMVCLLSKVFYGGFSCFRWWLKVYEVFKFIKGFLLMFCFWY